MRLAVCSWSYHRALEAKRIELFRWLRLCAEELRVDGVDLIAEHLPSRTRSCWLEAKRRCAEHRLTVVSLSPSNNFGKPSVAERQAEVDNINRWIETAVVLGAPFVRIFAGWPPAGRADELWAPMSECVRRVADTAAQAGVTLVVEPHNHGGFLHDSRTTLRLIRELDHPSVRINLDTGNYDEPDPYAGFEASMPLAPHVVAKVLQLTAEGEEATLDYGRIFALLGRCHYDGFVTLEYEGEADELETVPNALAMLRRYGSRYGMSA